MEVKETRVKSGFHEGLGAKTHWNFRFNPPQGSWRRQTLEPEIGTVEQLPLHLLARRQIQRRRQGQRDVHEKSRWTALGSNDLNFHHIFCLHD